jgi:FMN-dependent NADH-azoreductase
MAQLLHIDTSVQGDRSVSRRLTGRAAERWRAAHPGGTVTYRDLAVNPIPHLDAETGTARLVPAEARTPAQETSFAFSVALVDEIKNANTVLLGVPLYNFGAPSTVKAWVDTSSHPACPSTPKPAADSSAAPTSSSSPAAEADTGPAPRAKGGITPRPGCRTPSR